MKKLFYFILLSFPLISCNQKEMSEKVEFQKATDINNSSVKISNFNSCDLCQNFLYEYQKNYEIIYQDDFIQYDGVYRINFDNLNIFMNKCQLNKFFTKNYISRFNEKIVKIDQRLKSNPQSDGLIEGLESDVFLCTQEIDEFLNIILKKEIKCNIKNESDTEIDFGNNHVLIFSIQNNKINDIRLK